MLARAAVGELDGGARRRRPPDALPRALDRVRSPASGARQIETVTRSENAARGTVGRLFDLHRVGDDGSLRIVGRHAAGARECHRRRARHRATGHSRRLRLDREPEPVQPHPLRHPEGRPGRRRHRGDAAEPLRRGLGRRSVHRLSEGSRQQAGCTPTGSGIQWPVEPSGRSSRATSSSSGGIRGWRCSSSTIPRGRSRACPSSWPRPKVSIPRPVQSQPTAGPTP